MSRIYIRGLVRAADAVRCDLSQPLFAERKDQVRRTAEQFVRQVDAILARNAATLADLPAPSRRAYEFLNSVDVDATSPSPAAASDSHRPRSVSLVGLKSTWDAILHRLAQPAPADEADLLLSSIATSNAHVEQQLRDNGVNPRDLTPHSHAARGWLAFFADRDNFQAYVAAVTRAKSAVQFELERTRRFHPPAWLEFRAIPGLFKVRGDPNGTRIALPTPMICFSEGQFRALANAMFGGGSKEPIVEATLSDEYQSISAELDALSGVEEHPAGVHHDLRASFERVNDQYFCGDLACPHLTWSRTFTGRKFGHYDPIRDTVMLSSTLDQANVPPFVVDFVMYHELLHKKLGVSWQNGRRAIHTPEFKAEEARFAEHADAEVTLRRLASVHR